MSLELGMSSEPIFTKGKYYVRKLDDGGDLILGKYEGIVGNNHVFNLGETGLTPLLNKKHSNDENSSSTTVSVKDRIGKSKIGTLQFREVKINENIKIPVSGITMPVDKAIEKRILEAMKHTESTAPKLSGGSRASKSKKQKKQRKQRKSRKTLKKKSNK